jgi:hypothetical protein
MTEEREREKEEASKRRGKKNASPKKPPLSLTLNPSVNARCASLNSGVEKESLGSSSRRRASSWKRDSGEGKRGREKREKREREGFRSEAKRKKRGKKEKRFRKSLLSSLPF